MEGMTADRSDAELLRRSRHEPEAFGEFYDRHARAILAYCGRRTGCAETAADLTAEVFAAAYAKRGTYRDQGAPARSWLYGFARNELGTYLRKQAVSMRYRRRMGLERPDLGTDAIERLEALIDLQSIREELRTALAGLPAGQADAVRLRVVDELPYADVASRLGCSEGAARVRVTRALSSLSLAMEPS